MQGCIEGGEKSRFKTDPYVRIYLNSTENLGTFWQRGFYDHALRKEEDLRAAARYIVANPMRAGLVETIGDYPHWDAA